MKKGRVRPAVVRPLVANGVRWGRGASHYAFRHGVYLGKADGVDWWAQGELGNPSNGQPLRPCVKNSLFEQEIAEGGGREVLARWPSATELTRLKLMEFNGVPMVSLKIPPMVNLCGLV
jgi:hypothetical protein